MPGREWKLEAESDQGHEASLLVTDRVYPFTPGPRAWPGQVPIHLHVWGTHPKWKRLETSGDISPG